MHPDTGALVPASFPYTVESAAPAPADASRRLELAHWMTAPENPYFARSYVNRLWGYMMGRGLIEPIDDIRAGNPPTHPQLLDRLTEEFISEGFDVRYILRLICSSRTYQLSLATNEWNEDDGVNYSHAMARRLPAEVMYDAIHRATGSEVKLSGQRPGMMATELVDSTVEAGDGFLGLFGRPARDSVCECARSNNMSLGHALSLVNGPTVGDAIADGDNEIAELVRYEPDDAKVVEELFLRVLARTPSPEQTALFEAELDTSSISATAALEEADLASLHSKYDAWEASLPRFHWEPCEPGSVKTASGVEFLTQADDSFLVSDTAAEKDTYTVSVWTSLDKISGLRLETWRGESESGNYVLADLKLSAQGLKSSTPTHVPFSKVTADFSQTSWAVEGSIDADPNSGWGIYPERDKRHQAVFALKEPLETPGGAHLLLTMSQPFGSSHVIGHFRFSVTDGEGDVRYVDMDDAVLAALSEEPAARSLEAREKLHAAFMKTVPELSKKIRMSAARDITWALINSPAFLYNR
ncbi:MAG: DUF1553 domain-containing protein [Planctomycetes bacterium]|nr:DUF1553 domain-containing protein [Planctomycetota bacterium]